MQILLEFLGLTVFLAIIYVGATVLFKWLKTKGDPTTDQSAK